MTKTSDEDADSLTPGARPKPAVAGVVVTSTNFGGAEKYLVDLFGHPRVREEYEATLLGAFPGWETTGLGSRPMGLGAKWSRRNAARSLVAIPSVRRRGIRALRCFIEEQQPSFMHLQFKREQVLFTEPLARLAPVLWTEHGGLPRFNMWKAIAPAYRRSARHATTIICVADHVADDLEHLVGRGVPPLRVIEGGIDPAWIRPATPEERRHTRGRLGLPLDALVIAAVGRVHPQKRLGLLLESLAFIPDAVAVVCGDGPARATLEASAPAGRAHFTGFMSDPRDVYRAADVLAFPSGAREGFPYGLLEAAAAGLPAAVVHDSALTGSVEGWGTVAVEPTAEAYADAILAAATTGDPVAARRWAEARPVQRWVEEHLAVMRAVA